MADQPMTEKVAGGRIQWAGDDVDLEVGGKRNTLTRSNSRNSIDSIRSHRRASIDPSSALPIAYRTVSYQIAESQEKSVAELKQAKATAAKGSLAQRLLVERGMLTP